MNLALTDPFILAQDYPEALTGKLSEPQSLQIFHIVLTSHKGLDMLRALDSIAEEIFSRQAE